ncbi:hypothetical protein HUK80_10075 [Flavobacterium sp. MAH-1]|uniref:Uncharacterized protein n=1 Tax=Flavobacterium agri TaxID=2743471 RepID=A0A7Y9C5F8_9FLAO|nr:hypothetical protein [Flavobacterium agri]NUY81242.1 hypothetical protein [Flavobacterium agri]NYA71266.1 hypothetical protein [Flavobacterium agri]
MKSFYLLGLILCFSSGLMAQNTENPCQIAYSVEVVKKEATTQKDQYSANLNWDFSAYPAESDIKFEIVPIRDCWREVEGKQFGTAEVFKAQADKGSREFTLLGMKAKCFKWRAIITTADCNQTTDWKYYSFLPKN